MKGLLEERRSVRLADRRELAVSLLMVAGLVGSW